MNTLIVDDDGDMRLLLENRLRARGHRVTACADAETAWDAYQREVYTLIVLDWLLPGMNGLQLCCQIRALPHGNRSVILVFTGQDQPEDLQAVLEAGADDYLAKPVHLELLDVRLAVAERQVRHRAERKQAEEARRESEERFRDLFENANDLIQSVTLDGSFIYVNPAWQETLGYSEEEIAGLSLFDIIHPDSRAHCMEMLRRMTAGEQLGPVETTLLTKDGRSIIVEGSNSCLCKDGIPVAIRGIFRDITERKRSEEELKTFTAKLEEKTQELFAALEREKELGELKSRFISMASHEFRTPLTTVMVGCDLLRRYDEKTTAEQRADRLLKMRAAVERMTQMLDDVLLIGKVEAGRLEYNPTPLAIQAFCQDIAEDMQCTAGTHNILFSYTGSRVHVLVDEKLMRNSVTNLLSNAIKYSPQGSTVRFDVLCENDEVMFRVEDQGIGIPEEDQQRLFEPFHRAKNVGNIPGTGLGLAIIKKAVELHNGTIIVESKVDHGTVFTIVIPCMPQQEKRA